MDIHLADVVSSLDHIVKQSATMPNPDNSPVTPCYDLAIVVSTMDHGVGDEISEVALIPPTLAASFEAKDGLANFVFFFFFDQARKYANFFNRTFRWCQKTLDF